MKMRLGFAVAAHTDPDVLLIDEVLAVGDVAFRQKCIDYIYFLQRKGKTIVYVSHDSQQVQKMCDHVILLRKGLLVKDGQPEEVMSLYHHDMQVAL